MPAALLVADCIGKRFNGRAVLSAATMRAVPGQVRALVGRNGVGKSTLLKVGAGLVEPDTGTVHFDGEAQLGVSLAWLARRGVFFLPDHDLFSTTFAIGDQLAMIRRRFSGGNVIEALEATGVAGVAHRRLHQLSGGERRRAELAAILVRKPRCLLADEPFRGIAPLDAEVIATVLRRLAADGCAVVVTGHEVETLLAAADHVTWCTAGTTYELGPPASARKEYRFRQEYLGFAP
jgi:ABC-type multidrug transport system ATPase subunit